MAEGAAGASGGGSSSGGGGGGGGDTRPSESASAMTMRQALLLATQAVGANEAAVCEARAERDAITEEIEWVNDDCDGEIERARVRETGAVHATGSAAGGTESAERARQVLDAKSEERARQALLLVTQSLGVGAAAVREARAERDAMSAELDRSLVDRQGKGWPDADEGRYIDWLLSEAAREGALHVLRHALLRGADVDRKYRPSHETPLILATHGGHVDCLRLLLEAGADVNKGGSLGRPALIHAVEYGESDCVELLLEAGAGVDETDDRDGKTALMYGAEGPSRTHTYLCQRKDWGDFSRGCYKCFRLLLEAGADIEKADEHGTTALTFAAGDGGRDYVQLLLDAGADVDRADNFGETALMYAAERGLTGAVRLLLEAGADTEKADVQGLTALMLAMQEHGWEEITRTREWWENRLACVQLLLDAGADAKGTIVDTPLTSAAEAGNVDRLKRLLKVGADKDATSRATPPLVLAAKQGHIECLRLLLEAGADKDRIAGKNGSTALMWAAKQGHIECLRLLLEAGADKDKVRLSDGATALMLAAKHAHADCLRLLLEAGADAEKADALGRTAFNLVTKDRRKEGRRECIQLLLDNKSADKDK